MGLRGAGFALAVLACPAAAADKRPANAQPDWITRPTAEDLHRYYPKAAWALDLEGEAVVGCAVDLSGALKACKVLSEAPMGLGFGPAALRMTAIFRMSPMIKDGRPTEGGHVAIPIAFKQPTPPAAPPAAPADPQALSEARQFVELSGAADDLEARILAPYGIGEDDVTPPETAGAAAAAFREVLRAHIWELRDVPARALVAEFSPGELRDLAFAATQMPPGEERDARLGKVRRRAPSLDAKTRAIGDPLLRQVRAEARELFCRTHECEPRPRLADSATDDAP